MKTVNYGKLLILIEKFEITEKDLTIDIKLKNNASVQTIIFPIEEIRILADNQIIGLDNYKFENNLDPNQESSGQLFFKINNKPKKMILQFGKLSLPKINIDI
ncbi:MAG: hypothetical protein PHN56_01820 [Candidatus Nanoarchaeia archaeon]|nr:hypothetical protein [Candidatus Nanoarchaeia archaeon]